MNTAWQVVHCTRPDGETTQPNTGIVGVARQAATCAAAGLMEELKTRREEEGEDTLDTRLGGVKELAVGRCVVAIDGDGAVCAGRFDGLSHVSSPCRWLSVAMRHREGKALKDQAFGEKIGASPLNAMECGGDNRFEHMSLCVNE